MRRSLRAMTIALLLLVAAGCSVTNTAQDARHFPRDGVDVWDAAHEVARERARWTEVAACPVRGTLVFECRSRVFGFVDDFVASVDPAPGGGTVLRLDSRSRTGRSDFGVNAERIARFLDDVALRLAAHPERPTPAEAAGVGSRSH